MKFIFWFDFVFFLVFLEVLLGRIDLILLDVLAIFGIIWFNVGKYCCEQAEWLNIHARNIIQFTVNKSMKKIFDYFLGILRFILGKEVQFHRNCVSGVEFLSAC